MKNETTAKAIAAVLKRWLDRLTPPQGIKENPVAQQDEANALLRILLRFAPDTGYEQWASNALERMSESLKTRAWPTVHELGSLCSNTRKEFVKYRPMDDDPMDPHKINAKRILAGEPVGDGWVYGRLAAELVHRRMVSESDLTMYRSGLYFAMKDAWGEGPAKRREAEFAARHAAAVDAVRLAG